jgi:adenylate kinase
MIAFMGISGAGKSYLLKNMPSRHSYHVVTASELIKGQIKSRDSLIISSEQMRLSPTSDMQALLIEGVSIERQTAKSPIVLDCHAIVDKGDHLDPVPINVFGKIGVLRVIHLVVSPSEIWSRRRDDNSRTRPEISVEQIADHQNRSVAHARAISLAIQAEYFETNGSDLCELLKMKS